MTSTPTLTLDRRDDGVVVMTLDRPEKRNALNAELREGIVDALGELSADDTVKAVVIVGAGASFCAGFDLDEILAAGDPAAVFAHATGYHHAVHTFDKPLIAAIEGVAVAGGMDLALMCDVRIAATDARLGQPQVAMGVPAAYDLLATVVAGPVARELCLTGRVIDAAEAHALGVVNELVEPGRVLEAAVAKATAVAAVAGAEAMKRAFIAAQPELFTDSTSS